jgi:predicted transcriptional regulator
MAKSSEKLDALKLRKKGYSINAIAKKLRVSKGAVSMWCKNIHLSSLQKEALRKKSIKAGHVGRIIGAETNKKRKADRLRQAKVDTKREIGRLTRRDILMIGSALYWAEGSKSSNRAVFVNSDPQMILLMNRFFVDILKIDKNDIRITVQINHIHKARIIRVLRFWRTLLQLPREQFTEVYYVLTQPKKRYENYNSYYGIVRLAVRKGSHVQYKMLGYIESIKSR